MNLINRLVHKNLQLNKKRTIVTIVGILLSVALLSALSTLVASFYYSMLCYEIDQNGDYHYAFSGVDQKTYADLAANRSIESMYEISEVGYARLEGCENPDKPYVYVVATDRDGFAGAHFQLVEGRMPQNDREIVIARHIKTNGRVTHQVGETLTLEVGQRVSAGNTAWILNQSNPYQQQEEQLIGTEPKQYTIVGIMERPGYSVEEYTAPGYTCITYAEGLADVMTVYARYTKEALKNQYAVTSSILGYGDAYATLLEKVTVDNGRDISDEEFERYAKLTLEAPYTIYRNDNLLRYEQLFPMDSGTKLLFAVAVLVALVIMVTSVYCIKNSFDISITEKIRQYGMLASIGATRKQIKNSVRMEAAMLGVFGIPLGMLSGVLAAFVLIHVCNIVMQESLNLNLVFHVSLPALLAAMLLGILTIHFSARGSAKKAARVTPLEAIRNTNEIKLESRKLRIPGYVSKCFGIGGVVSYKNIKRNRRKYRTTVMSVILCSVTFIVISYFMGMAFDLVEMAYGTARANITLSLSGDSAMDMPALEQMTASLESVEEYALYNKKYFTLRTDKMTETYRKYLSEMQDEDVVLEDSVELLCLNQETFDRYAGACKLPDAEGKAILINETLYEEYDVEQERYETKQTTMYTFQPGDKLQLGYAEDTQCVELTLAGMTSERPLGYEQYFGTTLIVVSQTTWETLGLEKLEDGYNSYAAFVSSDADALQDDLEKLCPDATISNQDRARRQQESLYVMLGVFAYGLILVIALIGITNIINTLGTSIELRSREFATLRSVGMTQGQFYRMIRLESLFISAKSLVIGLPAGFVICYLICLLENRYDVVVPFTAPIGAMLLCAVTVIVLIYAIMYFSLTKIGKQNIIETIKNENV